MAPYEALYGRSSQSSICWTKVGERSTTGLNLIRITFEKDVELGIYEVERRPWVFKFDGSSTENSVGAGIVIISPKGIKTTLSMVATMTQRDD